MHSNRSVKCQQQSLGPTVCLWVIEEHTEAVDEVTAVERVTADTNAERLAKTNV